MRSSRDCDSVASDLRVDTRPKALSREVREGGDGLYSCERSVFLLDRLLLDFGDLSWDGVDVTEMFGWENI